jgi:Uma2 family endonuclease
MTTKPTLLTADDLLRLYSEGVRGELVQGVLYETTPTGLKHGEIAVALGAVLWIHVRPQRLGRVFGSDSGVLLERNPDTVREPDVAYVSAERLPLDTEIAGYCPVLPDLVVEIVSPSDKEENVDNKAIMWLYYGARMALVINPETQTIRVRQANGPTRLLSIDDTLDGEDVLPGFTCPVRDILES